MHRCDHPQYHPTVFKTTVRQARRALTEDERAKHAWRGGAKVRK